MDYDTHPNSTSARCPGSRARSTRRSRAVSSRSRTFKAQPRDATPLKHARAHVHQAAGAIQMVGLDAVVAFTDEIERQLARLEELAGADARRRLRRWSIAPAASSRSSSTSSSTARRRCRSSSFPNTRRCRRRAASRPRRRPTSSIPTSSPRAPRIAPREVDRRRESPAVVSRQAAPAVPARPARLAARRRGGRRDDARRDRRHRGRQTQSSQPARILVDGRRAARERSSRRASSAGFGVKQLCGARRPADPPRRRRQRARSPTGCAAKCSTSSPSARRSGRRCRRCSARSGCTGLIPSAEVLSADVVRMQPLLREAREQLAGGKDAWLKAASGRAENLPKLKQTLASVHAKAAEIEQRRADEARPQRWSSASTRCRRPACPSRSRWNTRPRCCWPRARSRTTRACRPISRSRSTRCSRASTPRAQDALAPARGAPMLDEMSKRAQERVLLAQVGREIQANLRHMEQVLDAFFRDNAKRADLATLAQGQRADPRRAAHARPRRGRAACSSCASSRSTTYANPDAPVEQRGPRAARRVAVGPRLLHRGGRAAAARSRPPDRAAARQAPRRSAGARRGTEPTRSRRRSPNCALRCRSSSRKCSARRPTPPRATALKQKLAGLRDDAELIGDARSRRRRSTPRCASSRPAARRALAAAVDADRRHGAAPAPEISEETQRLLDDRRERSSTPSCSRST